MVEIYNNKNPGISGLIVQLDIVDAEDSLFLTIDTNGMASLGNSSDMKPHIIFNLSKQTLEAIYIGETTGLTQMGRENLSDRTPLDFMLGETVDMSGEWMTKLLTFVQRFFNPTHPERIVLERASSRLVHGAWATPMFYHAGFRSAWYQLEKGQMLNKPGDVNSFSQAFVIIDGNGYAKIGADTIGIRAGNAYYIPQGSEHIAWTESDSPMKMIFLAWGEGA